jgi:polyribonucleotide nucleotidyltransferase
LGFAVERQIGKKKLRIETGDIARQSHGAALVKYGDTVVLVTVVSADARPGMDFFPLFLQYREKLSAVGKIPGGRFMKREGRPTLKEILTMRMMDRPLRPLFPPTYMSEVQVTGVVLSADNDCCDPDVLAMVGASASLCLSPIPFNGPVGTIRVARIDGELVINPSLPEAEAADFALVVSGTRDRVVMLEGEANEVPESEIADAIIFAQRELQPIIDMQEELVAEIGVTKELPPDDEFDEELYRVVKGKIEGRIRDKITLPTQPMRKTALKDIRDSLLDEMCGEDEKDPADPKQVKACFERMERDIVRGAVISGTRVDGRELDKLRGIDCKVGILPRTHGSALFQRGETQALVTATLGTSRDEELVVGLQEEYSRKFMLQYSHPGYAVGEAKPDRGPSRRDTGHGALAEKALSKVLPDDFPYTIRLVSDIMESNGSTSQASVCGATLCLMDAGVQIRRPVAGISIGMVEDNGKAHLLTDITGSEDHFGDMDFKVAGTQRGMTALQVDVKNTGLTEEMIRGAMEKATEARMQILRHMLDALDTPREAISEFAPRLLQIKIDPDTIGKLIGPGGKMIRKIEEESGAKVEVDDDGTVTVSSSEASKANAAREFIEKMFERPEVGKIYEGRVTGIKDFGAFVEILPGTDGLCHVSELADKFVDSVEDEVSMGDVLRVKVIAVDNQGRIKLSRKVVLQEEADGDGGDKEE